MANDFLYAIFKVGDQETAVGKEHAGMKDGMLVTYIDPNEYDCKLSDHMKKVFAIIKVPLLWKDYLRTGCEMTGDVDSPDFRARKSIITLSDIESALASPGLESSWRGKNIVEPVDGSVLNSNVIKSSEILNESVEDVNSISSGSYTVGSSGDYAVWSAAFADLANFTGDITLTQISTFQENTSAAMTENLGSYKLTLDSDSPSFGDVTAGWKTNINVGSYSLFFWAYTGSGANVEVKNLNIIAALGGANTIYAYWQLVSISGTTTISIHDCVCNGNTRFGNAVFLQSSVPVVKLWNLKVYKFQTNGFLFNSGVVHASSKTENVTFYSIGTSAINYNDNTTEVRNCVAHGCSFINLTNVTGTNCAHDGTGAIGFSTENGTIDEIVDGDFDSVTTTSSSFLDISISSQLSKTGATPQIAENTTDMHGYDRGASNTSIGAVEPVPIVVINGTGTGTLPSIEVDGAGDVNLVTGTGTATLPLMEADSTGVLVHSGTSTLTLPVVEIDGIGYKGETVTGTSVLTLPSIIVHGFENVGSGGSGYGEPQISISIGISPIL